jgi:hypothetical protein
MPMPNGARFVYDYQGVGAWMRTDPTLAAAVRARADLAAELAKSLAPVGTPEEGDHHPGHFRDSIDVEGPIRLRDRLGFGITSSADYADAVEANHHVFEAVRHALSDPRGGPGL